MYYSFIHRASAKVTKSDLSINGNTYKINTSVFQGEAIDLEQTESPDWQPVPENEIPTHFGLWRLREKFKDALNLDEEPDPNSVDVQTFEVYATDDEQISSERHTWTYQPLLGTVNYVQAIDQHVMATQRWADRGLEFINNELAIWLDQEMSKVK